MENLDKLIGQVFDPAKHDSEALVAHDLFVCEDTGRIHNIDDSVRLPDGRLVFRLLPEAEPKLYPFVTVTSNGSRTWQAEDSSHACEQHIDAFGDDPDEAIQRVYMDVDALPDADEPVKITLRVADAEILRLLLADVTDDPPYGSLDERITEAHLLRIDAAVCKAMIEGALVRNSW